HHHLDLSLERRLRRLINELWPDIVHTHLLHSDTYGIPAARLARIPTVITSRHNDNAFRQRGAIKALNQGLWRMVSAGIAISEAIRRFCVEVEGAPTAKLHTIHYGFELPVAKIDRKEARAAL